MPQDNDPVKAEVRYVPETGSKRPWELWLSSVRGSWYQRGSFATEEKAKAKAVEVGKIFGF